MGVRIAIQLLWIPKLSAKERIIQKLMKRFKLTEEKAEQYYIKFGK